MNPESSKIMGEYLIICFIFAYGLCRFDCVAMEMDVTNSTTQSGKLSG